MVIMMRQKINLWDDQRSLTGGAVLVLTTGGPGCAVADSNGEMKPEATPDMGGSDTGRVSESSLQS